ncbi:hypothetical protein HanPI659440_Chr13g0512761 [Helianthus annuus]|nr:hypothetical protein HanPI659440_Chr13g0512761 [Helianthus annuus]
MVFPAPWRRYGGLYRPTMYALMTMVVVIMDLDEATFLQASGGDFVTRKVKRQRDIRRNRKREDEDQELREGAYR